MDLTVYTDEGDSPPVAAATGFKKKRRRTELTFADKVLALNLLDQKNSQSEVARRLGCSQACVSLLSANRQTILAMHESHRANPERKRMRFGKAADVGDALLRWYSELKSPHVPITTEVLMAKATELARRKGKGDFVPSAGWIWRWKIRHGLISKKKRDCENGTKNQQSDVTAMTTHVESDRLVVPSCIKQENDIDWTVTGENDSNISETSELIDTHLEQDKHDDSDESFDRNEELIDPVTSNEYLANSDERNHGDVRSSPVEPPVTMSEAWRALRTIRRYMQQNNYGDFTTLFNLEDVLLGITAADQNCDNIVCASPPDTGSERHSKRPVT